MWPLQYTTGKEDEYVILRTGQPEGPNAGGIPQVSQKRLPFLHFYRSVGACHHSVRSACRATAGGTGPAGGIYERILYRTGECRGRGLGGELVPHPQTSAQNQPVSKRDAESVQTEPAKTTYTITVTDGCLQVYIAQTGQLYMETAIEYDLLPDQVQEQIDAGKNFESEQELLEFLENYSS